MQKGTVLPGFWISEFPDNPHPLPLSDVQKCLDSSVFQFLQVSGFPRLRITPILIAKRNCLTLSICWISELPDTQLESQVGWQHETKDRFSCGLYHSTHRLLTTAVVKFNFINYEASWFVPPPPAKKIHLAGEGGHFFQ